MVEFTKTTQCKFCGEIYPSIIGHICIGSWPEQHSTWQSLPDNRNAGEDAILNDILAELRQIRQMLEKGAR